MDHFTWKSLSENADGWKVWMIQQNIFRDHATKGRMWENTFHILDEWESGARWDQEADCEKQRQIEEIMMDKDGYGRLWSALSDEDM